MNVRLVTSIAAVALSAPAQAQLLGCWLPHEPYIPSGFWAEYHEMQIAEDEVDRYLADIDDYIACLYAEIAEAERAADAVIREWNNAVDDFNR